MEDNRAQAIWILIKNQVRKERKGVLKVKMLVGSNYQARLAARGPAVQVVGTQLRLRFNVCSFFKEGSLLDFLSFPP